MTSKYSGNLKIPFKFMPSIKKKYTNNYNLEL